MQPAVSLERLHKGAQDRLPPDGRAGAIVIRKDRNNKKLAVWQPMIAGSRQKVRNSGEISRRSVPSRVYQRVVPGVL